MHFNGEGAYNTQNDIFPKTVELREINCFTSNILLICHMVYCIKLNALAGSIKKISDSSCMGINIEPLFWNELQVLRT